MTTEPDWEFTRQALNRALGVISDDFAEASEENARLREALTLALDWIDAMREQGGFDPKNTAATALTIIVLLDTIARIDAVLPGEKR